MTREGDWTIKYCRKRCTCALGEGEKERARATLGFGFDFLITVESLTKHHRNDKDEQETERAEERKTWKGARGEIHASEKRRNRERVNYNGGREKREHVGYKEIEI
jgi:hypothetical protein